MRFCGNEPKITKFAFVSYFPNSTKFFPTFMFIADPPMANMSPMDRWHGVMLHYKNVLESSHFGETLPTYRRIEIP